MLAPPSMSISRGGRCAAMCVTVFLAAAPASSDSQIDALEAAAERLAAQRKERMAVWHAKAYLPRIAAFRAALAAFERAAGEPADWRRAKPQCRELALAAAAAKRDRALVEAPDYQVRTYLPQVLDRYEQAAVACHVGLLYEARPLLAAALAAERDFRTALFKYGLSR